MLCISVETMLDYSERKIVFNGRWCREEEMTEDIFAINYQKEIDKAAAQGNYRLSYPANVFTVTEEICRKKILSGTNRIKQISIT